MYRFRLLLFLASGLGLQVPLPANAGAEGAAPTRRPNILFIFTDDQSWRTLSCYRRERAWPWAQTPNIDRLAREGVRFTHAYGAAWCSPSRACVLTGLLPHGIEGLHIKSTCDAHYDPKVCRFWPAQMRRAGYRTAHIGKWHLAHDAGYGRDWDHSVCYFHCDWQGDVYNDQPLAIDGAPPKVVKGYSTDLFTDYAVDFINKSQAQPWCLWLCYVAPHLPNTVAPRHRERYTGADVPIPSDIFGPFTGKPRYVDVQHYWERRTGSNGGVPVYRAFIGADKNAKERVAAFVPQPLPELVRGYNRLVPALDEGVGRLLRTLEQTGQLDKTLIIFTSDQGFAWGEHGFVQKVAPYDACLRVPLLVRLPGVAAKGGVCRYPVTVVDLPPTLLGVAGVPLPWTMHGHDLRPVLRDPNARWDHPAIMEHFRWAFGSQTKHIDRGPPTLGLTVPWWIFHIKGKYKYIRTLAVPDAEELYDLDADPEELRNLALEQGYQKLLPDLRRRLLDELRRTKAGLVQELEAR